MGEFLFALIYDAYFKNVIKTKSDHLKKNWSTIYNSQTYTYLFHQIIAGFSEAVDYELRYKLQFSINRSVVKVLIKTFSISTYICLKNFNGRKKITTKVIFVLYFFILFISRSNKSKFNITK